MNTRELELLHSLMTLGSVSEAARAQHMSQPNASKILRKMEDTFGFELFERSNAKLFPTAEARLLFDQLESTLMSLNRFRSMTEDIREMSRGTIALGGLPLLSRYWLPDVLSDFIHEYPDIDVTLHTRSSRKLIELVADRQLDLAVGLLHVDDPLIDCTELAKTDFVVALPSEHPLAKKKRLSARDLHDQDFISLSVLDHTREQIDRHFSQAGSMPRIRCECSLPVVALRMVENQVGLALVDRVTARENQRDSLAFRKFTPAITATIWLMRPRLRPQSRILSLFAEKLIAQAASEQWLA